MQTKRDLRARGAQPEGIDAFIEGATASKAEEKKKASPGRPAAEDAASRTRQTFVISTRHLELIREASYWDRIEQKDIIAAALDMYFSGKSYQPLPEKKG